MKARLKKERYWDVWPVGLLMTIPRMGFLTPLTLYAEMGEIRRFSTPGKLAHCSGLVPRVHESADIPERRMSEGEQVVEVDHDRGRLVSHLFLSLW